MTWRRPGRGAGGDAHPRLGPCPRRRWVLISTALVTVSALLGVFVFMSRPGRPPSVGEDPVFPPLSVTASRGRAMPAASGPVIHVRQGASNGRGTEDRPFGSISKAVDYAPGGATILIGSGVYHETVTIEGPRDLTLRAAPGAEVWLDGTDPLVSPEPAGARWRYVGQAPHLDTSPTYTRGAPDNTTPGWRFVSPEHPLAADPSQVWLDEVRLRQVAPVEKVMPGTFAVDGDDIVIGDDPTGHRVAVGTRPHAIITTAPGVRVEDLGIRRYVPSVPDFGAVVVGGRGSALSGVVVVDASTTGISVQGEDVALTNVTVQGSGMLGVHADEAHGLTVEGGHVAQNNALSFNSSPVAGGLKLTRSTRVTVRGLRVSHNTGNGLWMDEGVAQARVARVAVESNSLHGILVELSTQVEVAGCRMLSNGGNGLRVQNSDDVDVWNVSSSGNRRAIDFVQDGRRAGRADAPRLPADSRFPRMTWRIGDSVVANSVLGPSTGDADLAVEDFTRTLNADDIGIRLESNVYRRDVTGTPRWTQAWSRPRTDPAVYTDVQSFAAAHGQDLNSVEQRTGGIRRWPVPTPVPGDVAEWAGLGSSSPGVGAPG